jgi:orotidine-5'-phosphate decarboxylase
MKQRNFRDLIQARWAENGLVCVGLDSDYEKLPKHLRDNPGGPAVAIRRFNQEIIDTTSSLRLGAYKLDTGFYEKMGADGNEALFETMEYIRAVAPHVPIILDGKRGGIGDTNKAYAEWAFDYLAADALTVNPYIGGEALSPILERADKGIFVLCRTSNPGAGEFQDLDVLNGEKLYERVARHVSGSWNKLGNCGLVVGATYPHQLNRVRIMVGDNLPILIPGVGKQQADVGAAVKAGVNTRGNGIIVSSSSAIIFASAEEDFAEAAATETAALSQKIRNALDQMQEGGSDDQSERRAEDKDRP